MPVLSKGSPQHITVLSQELPHERVQLRQRGRVGQGHPARLGQAVRQPRLKGPARGRRQRLQVRGEQPRLLPAPPAGARA